VTSALPQCQVCAGPCIFYAGDRHGWTCRKCLAAYVDGQIAAQDARTEADRAKGRVKALTAKLAQHRKNRQDMPGSDGERRSGGLAAGRTAPVPAAATTTTTGGA
jgi:anti-sigma factor RsiW